MSLTEAAEEEAAMQVYATHERIMTESNPEPARRRPSGIAFRDTSEQLVADMMQALKASRKSNKSQSLTRGSSQGTGVLLEIPNDSTVILTTLSEGTSTKLGVPYEEMVTSKAKVDVILDWGSEKEKKKYDDDADDDKSIDLEKTDDEEIDDEFVHSEEYVQDDEETDDEFVQGDEQVNDDEDEEMTNAKDADTRNDDEEITDTVKADAEKTKEVKDDNKKAKLPPSSSSLSVSLSFVTSTTTPPQYVFTISPVLQQTTTPTPTPPITTENLSITMILDQLPVITVNAYLGSILGDALQKVLQKHTEELKQQYSQQVDYKDVIEESVQANIINEAPTPDLEWNKRQVVDDQPKQSWFNNMVSAAKDPLTVNELMATPIDFSKYTMNRLKIVKLRKAYLVGSVYKLLKGTCKSSIELEYNMEESSRSSNRYCRILLQQQSGIYEIIRSKKEVHCVYHEDKNSKKILNVVSVKVKKLHGYGHLEEIMARRVDRQLYKLKEGDFVNLHLNDIEDILLLVVQHKLFQLDDSDIVDFIVALRMFTRSLIIKRRVEDVQLGVESYQKKLNLTKPQKTFLGIVFKELYTPSFDPP
ncbi:hypothetical protein Tco_1368289 [Tanacetum coccineum]